MNVVMLRQARRIDFHDWTDDYKVPIGTLPRYFVEQLHVEALVNNSEETKPRMRNIFLVRRFGNLSACLSEMIAIYAAGKRVHRVMLVTLCFVKTLAAGENE